MNAPNSIHSKRRLLLAAGLLSSCLAMPALAIDPPKSPDFPVAPDRVGTATNAALIYYQAWDRITREDNTAVSDAHKTDATWKPDQKVTEILVRNQPFVLDVMRAAATESCEWGVQYNRGWDALLPHLGKMRATARFISADSRRLFIAGDSVNAAKRIAALYRIAKHTENDHILISTLVGVAIASVGNSNSSVAVEHKWLTPSDAREILNAAKALDGDDLFGFKSAIAVEREMSTTWPKEHFKGPTAGAQLVKTMGQVESNDNKPVIEPLAVMNEEQIAVECDRAQPYFNEVLAAWDAKDSKEQIGKLETRLQSGDFGALARVLAPAFIKARSASEKARLEHEAVIKQLEKYIREYDTNATETPATKDGSAVPAPAPNSK